jgi:hypothetical protein
MHKFVLYTPVPAQSVEMDRLTTLAEMLKNSKPHNGGIKLYPYPGVRDENGAVLTYIFCLNVDILQVYQVCNTTDHHYADMADILNDLLAPCGFRLDDFAVCRVEYCHNIVVADADDRVLAFQLVQAVPTRAMYTRRESSYSTSVYAKSKSRIINAYDKDQERKYKARKRTDPNFLPRPYERDVIRMEVQVKKEHIRYKRRNGLASTYANWINAAMEQAYLKQLYKMIPPGDFLSKSAAIAKINGDTTIGSGLRKNLVGYINIIAHGNNMDAALKKYSYNTAHRYLEYCSSKGFSPITIPDDRGIDFLPSPFVLP